MLRVACTLLYFPPSHARCPCSFRLGVSRDDRHSRLAPSAASDTTRVERWRIAQQATGIHWRYMFAFYDCYFKQHFTVSDSYQLNYCKTPNIPHPQTPHNPVATMPTPIDRAMNSRVCSPHMSRVTLKLTRLPELLPWLCRYRHSSGSMVNLGPRYVPATARPQG